MYYISIWCIALIVSIVLFQKASGSLSLVKPNVISITFYYSLLITSFIGTLLIALGVDQHYMIDRLRDESVRHTGFWLIVLVMVLMPTVMVIVSGLSRFESEVELTGYLEKKVALEDNKMIFFLFSILAAIGVFAVAYTYLNLRQIPLLGLVTGASSHELAQMRIEASRDFGGNIYIRNIFALQLVPLLSLIAFVYGTVSKQVKWRLWFIILLGASILISLYDLAKAPIFFYFLMLLLTSIYIGQVKLNLRKITVLALGGVTGLIVMYVFIQDVTSLNQFLSYNTGPLGRLILAQISPFFLHLDLFGNYVPYLGGKSLPSSFLALYDLEHIRSARLTLEYYFPDRVEDGTGGVLNTIYIAEAYANFGYLGVVAGTIYIGLFLQGLYIIFLRLKKHPILIGLFVYFTINIPRTIVGGFADFLYNPIWIAATVLTAGILIFYRFYSDASQRWPVLKLKRKL
ncbi:O-antigen polymerase [Alkalihalobacillus deserti]|uniref:O-antigen polymerase n=1 Tax=Alkalihalobacillus deserti TaxID=2879466 RepID=UPI001D15492C|nr:O-antigen polymerase [Alkalihalobacillus deserti]